MQKFGELYYGVVNEHRKKIDNKTIVIKKEWKFRNLFVNSLVLRFICANFRKICLQESGADSTCKN